MHVFPDPSPIQIEQSKLSQRAFGVKFTVRLIRHTVGRSSMQNTKCWRGSIFENLLIIHVSYHRRKKTCFLSSSWKNGSRISSWNISCVCSFQTFPSLRWKWNLILLHLHPLPEIRKYTFWGTQVFNSLAHICMFDDGMLHKRKKQAWQEWEEVELSCLE